uniref:DNA gyrase subunit A n=1 Tax=candidate division WOR-3 bacterium TaxID=2052148 RepID=A0A7V6CMK1_UNCW3
MKEEIITVYIEDEIKKSYLDYAMSVIIGRALPDFRDGLKPVQRRILYSMYELGLFSNRPFKKSATVVGDVLGKYHPHGDMAVYDALVRMAQDFSMRYPLIQGQGNFGSIDGDAPAAYRYTEARLTPLAEELLKNIEKDTVDFVPNFDNRLKEPVLLPATFPNVLLNGASGIAVGMATNIPPHNFREVVDGLVALIDNPNLSEEKLFNYIKGPDFPTGGIIVGTEGIKEAYLTGKGKIIVRGRVKFEETKGGRERIVITEIPYQVNKAALIEKIAELVREKKIEGISDLRDESDRDGIRIVIDLKRDVSKEVILSQLYAHTPLQETFGIIFLGIIDNVPKLLNLKEICQTFLEFRYQTFYRQTKFELNKAEEKAHILEGFKIALDNIDKIINLIKNSKDTEKAREGLMKKFKLTEKQANAILDMRLARLTSLERKKIEDEYLQTIKEISRLKSLLASKPAIMQEIKKELLILKEKYGDNRRTDIIEGKIEEVKLEDLIAEEDVTILITHKGYIKRMSVSSYRKQSRGGIGRSGAEVGEEDFCEHLITAQTKDYLLFFTNKGKCYWLKVYEIPEGSFQSKGRPIVNLLELEKDEKICATLSVKEFNKKNYIFMITSLGKVKKVSLAEFANPRKKGIIAIKLIKNDYLVDTFITNGKNEIVIFTKKGQTLRFLEKDVRVMGRNAAGVLGIRLEKGDEVCSGAIIKEEEKLLFVTENGYGKLVSYQLFPKRKRGGKGVIGIKITEKTGELIKVIGVKEEDEIIIGTLKGTVIRLKVSEIKELSRQASGIKLISLKEDDKVVDVARVIVEE